MSSCPIHQPPLNKNLDPCGRNLGWSHLLWRRTINTHCSDYMPFKLNGQVGFWIVVPLHVATKMWVSIFFPLQLFLFFRLSFLRRTMSLIFFFFTSLDWSMNGNKNWHYDLNGHCGGCRHRLEMQAVIWNRTQWPWFYNSISSIYCFKAAQSIYLNNHEHWLIRLGWKEDGSRSMTEQEKKKKA